MLSLLTAVVLGHLQDAQRKPDLADLQHKWVGKRVWLCGATAEWEGEKYCWNPAEAVVVEAVDRIPTGRFKLRPESWNAIADAGYGILINEPLRFRLRVKNAVDAARSAKEEPDIALLTVSSYNAGQDRSVELIMPSEHEFGRWIATTSPKTLLRGCSPRIQRAFVERRVVRGMPKQLVVRLTGYPERDMPADAQWKLRLWDFDCVDPAPFTYQIHFDRNGKVTKLGSAGELP